MHFTNAVTIFIARELASPMVDMLMIISPGLETAIKGSQRGSRVRSEKGVDADSKAKRVEAPWRRKDRPSLG